MRGRKKELGKDVEDMLFYITVTEYFTGEGYDEVTEKKMDLITPVRNCLGALYGYAIDYCKFHNMRSDNYFVIRVYSATNGNRAKKMFEKVVSGTLSEGDYNIPIVVKPNKKPVRSKKDIKDRRPVKISKYDEYVIIEDISHGATISDIMLKYNLGYEQSKELVSDYRCKEDLKEYEELMKEKEEK